MSVDTKMWMAGRIAELERELSVLRSAVIEECLQICTERANKLRAQRRARDDWHDEIAAEFLARAFELEDAARAMKALHTATGEKGEQDGLLPEVLHLLEWVTYHDGRYCQEQNIDFQTKAQALVHRLAKLMGREPYQDMGPK